MAGESTASSRRGLEGHERRTVALLGIPTLELALAVTVVTTYLPVVAAGFGASNVIIGVIIGAEGLMALWLPLVAGIWSDRLDTRLGGRLPFLLGATPVIVAGLAAMALVSSIVTLAAASLVFFGGYFSPTSLIARSIRMPSVRRSPDALRAPRRSFAAPAPAARCSPADSC